jgi:citrate lyase synthetase
METLLRRCGFDEVEFYKERSMHEKAKMKLDLYFSQDSKISKRIKKIIFWLMRTLPFTKNKMVVVARKA